MIYAHVFKQGSEPCAVDTMDRTSPKRPLLPVLDGVYRCGAEGEPVFVEVPAPTDEALQTVLHKIITRMMKLLTGKEVLVEEQGQTYMADDDSDSDEARALRPLQAAAWPCRPRRASGPAPRQAQTVHWTV